MTKAGAPIDHWLAARGWKPFPFQREVWKGERPLAEILKDHGVTESGWREAKRARGKP